MSWACKEVLVCFTFEKFPQLAFDFDFRTREKQGNFQNVKKNICLVVVTDGNYYTEQNMVRRTYYNYAIKFFMLT